MHRLTTNEQNLAPTSDHLERFPHLLHLRHPQLQHPHIQHQHHRQPLAQRLLRHASNTIYVTRNILRHTPNIKTQDQSAAPDGGDVAAASSAPNATLEAPPGAGLDEL
ncbi:hypothetical protein CVT26_010599 [Gymnopilus dilepis]|uniref:Uncharacterized protein n=1 Tax=Gymnopilus dilepis TaxID=231916 RepID=A0A409VZF4_9AGAR|nr:hypothetical protein CVT26_010599 [Gymnopilus dilepis]